MDVQLEPPARVSLMPSLDDIQGCINKSAQAILGCFKQVQRIMSRSNTTAYPRVDTYEEAVALTKLATLDSRMSALYLRRHFFGLTLNDQSFWCGVCGCTVTPTACIERRRVHVLLTFQRRARLSTMKEKSYFVPR